MRRGGLLAFALFLGVALVYATPAAAAEVRAAKAGAHAAEPAQHDGGHKPVDDSPFAGEVNQILDLAIWTVLVFILLYVVLRAFAWKPMLAGLKQREDSIRGALAEAAKAREEAHALRA